MNDMKSSQHKGKTFYYITKDVDISLRWKNGVDMATSSALFPWMHC